MPTEDCAWPFTQWCPLLLMTSVTTRCCVPHFIAKKADAQRSQAACPKLPRTSLQLVALGIELRSFWPLGTAFLFENSPVPSGWAVSQILLQPYAWVYNPGWAKQAQGFLVGGLSWVQPHAWPFPRENASFPSLSLPHGLSYTTDWAMENTDPRMAKAQAELRPHWLGTECHALNMMSRTSAPLLGKEDRFGQLTIQARAERMHSPASPGWFWGHTLMLCSSSSSQCYSQQKNGHSLGAKVVVCF